MEDGMGNLMNYRSTKVMMTRMIFIWMNVMVRIIIYMMNNRTSEMMRMFYDVIVRFERMFDNSVNNLLMRI